MSCPNCRRAPLDCECEHARGWNAQADEYNRWESLDVREKADWVLVTKSAMWPLAEYPPMLDDIEF